MRGLGKLGSKWSVSINYFSSHVTELGVRGGRKIVRARGDGGPQGNVAFYIQEDSHTHELTGTVTARAMPLCGSKPTSVSQKLSPIGNHSQILKKLVFIFSNGVSNHS